jgi:hypothetical protein
MSGFAGCMHFAWSLFAHENFKSVPSEQDHKHYDHNLVPGTYLLVSLLQTPTLHGLVLNCCGHFFCSFHSFLISRVQV